MNKDIDCSSDMTTRSGKYVDPRNLKPEDIDIDDIASGLAKTCRYAGQCIGFYSVAEHSVFCAKVVYQETHDLKLARIALLHDAPEAYLGDLVRCVKQGLPDYQALEDKVWVAICQKFRLGLLPDTPVMPLPDEVLVADRRLCVTERKQIIFDKSKVWDLEQKYEPYPLVVLKLEWREARVFFLNAFHQLFSEGCLSI